MNQTAIILNNSGNDVYAQTSREFLASPVKAILMRVLLSNTAQIGNIIKIRNSKSFGSQSNRDISLSNFISVMDKTNLIIDIPLDPPVILDGQTSFQTVIEANSDIYFLFYINQSDLSTLLT
jgi:hypothetical protein